MTKPLYGEDAYRRSAPGCVTAIVDGKDIRLDASLFYPTGGGQAGDGGRLVWDGGQCRIATTVKDEEGAILVPAEGETLPPEGTEVTQEIDWPRRHACMRLHTALHLLSVVIPMPVTGGQITDRKGRLDFDMPDAPEDKAAVEARLNDLVAADYPVSETWITEAELAANPGLVKTMSVMPPSGQGHVRLIRIGPEDAPVDLQPCGGTHVARTGEIGPVRLGKIEKKGRHNRRVTVTLAEESAAQP